MERSARWFPFTQLPPGFARSLDHPPTTPLLPRPASSLILLRRGSQGAETLLLRRSPRMGFIPGAYVFPGGRVDAADGSPEAMARMPGLDPEALGRRLGLVSSATDRAGSPPAHAFLTAALRETFEETGILLGAPPAGCRSHPPRGEAEGGRIRGLLLDGSLTFTAALDALGVELAGRDLEYVGHWITPEREPRRYDTRFFSVEVPAGCPVLVDHGEMEEGVWMSAQEALARNAEGTLPLVYPTLRTLETLSHFSDPASFLAHHRDKPIPRVLPELRRGNGGIEIVVEGPDQV